LVVNCNIIPRFMVFVSNDMCVSVTIFGCLFFRVFPIVKTINKICCNTINDDEIIEVVGHAYIRQNWIKGCSCIKKEGTM